MQQQYLWSVKHVLLSTNTWGSSANGNTLVLQSSIRGSIPRCSTTTGREVLFAVEMRSYLLASSFITPE